MGEEGPEVFLRQGGGEVPGEDEEPEGEHGGRVVEALGELGVC